MVVPQLRLYGDRLFYVNEDGGQRCMVLIFEGRLEKGIASRGKHVGVFISIPKKYLSEIYDLPPFHYYTVEGEILDIKKFWGELEKEELKLKEVVGQKIEFALSPALLGTYDFLYISERSWTLFRDYGIFPEDYVLRVKLSRIKLNEETLEIYPKRDVVVT
jgi:hypothetical protein